MTSRATAWMAPTLLALACLAATVAPAIAHADNAVANDPKVIARAKLVEGGDLLKQGDFKEALARFKEAYDLVQSPKIQYNFGLAYRGLGRNADAIEAFERFLNDATDASPDLRANAERYRSALGQQTTSLTIESDVDGAEISVDGRSYGATPARAPIRLDPGPHQVLVEKTGAPAFTQKINAVGGQRLTVQVKLAKDLPALAQGPTPAANPAAVQPSPAAAPAAPAESRHTLRWKAAWGGAAVAAGLLVFGVVERMSANSKFEEFNKRTPPLGQCDADDRVLDHGGGDCSALLSAGNSAATKANVGLIVGGLLGAASVAALAITWNERVNAGDVAFGCSPLLSRQPGLTCALRF